MDENILCKKRISVSIEEKNPSQIRNKLGKMFLNGCYFFQVNLNEINVCKIG